MAGNDEPPANEEEVCSPLTNVSFTVILDDDCLAMQYCEFEFLVYDLPTCGDDSPPIAHYDYTYNNPTYFNLTINNNYVRICVRVKPGTTCNYTNYAPKCTCKPTATSMTFNFNICSP